MPKKPSLITVSQFKGMKDDNDPKLIGPEYFQHAVNFNFPDDGTLGLTKILMPESVKNLTGTPSEGKSIDGIHGYSFIAGDSNGNYKSYYFFCVVSYGYLYVYDQSWSPVNFILDFVSQTGINYMNCFITPGKVSMQTYKGNLFISNGIDNPVVFYGTEVVFSFQASLSDGVLLGSMGMPVCKGLFVGGGNFSNDGDIYYYAMTFVTAGGEEYIGGKSWVQIQNKTAKNRMYLPFGYSGVTSRKIYRTKANGSALYLLATINNNTDIYYDDGASDASLPVTTIPQINNQCPKPHFLSVFSGCLYGAKNSLYPTQVYKTDAGIQVFDAANYIEISDMSNDNTPVQGVGSDFSALMVGTSKNIYMLTPNSADATITDVNPTRANIGIKDGRTVKNVPAYGDFPGGLMFVSTNNDVRLMNGLNALPVATTVNNVRTQDFAGNIRGSLLIDLASYDSIYSEYFNYRYYILITRDSTTVKYVFDIRTQGWTKHLIETMNYSSQPKVLAVLNTGTNDLPVYGLFNGNDSGIIEQEYKSIQYRGENVNAYLVSGYIAPSADFKVYEKIRFWFKSYDANGGTATIRIVLDDNLGQVLTETATVTVQPYDPAYYDLRYFQAQSSVDFKVSNINNSARWIKYSVSCETGSISLQKVEILGDLLNNQEG